MKTETTWEHSDYLHWPARADHLEDMEQHLNKAARLSRALWVALSSVETDTQDARTRSALIELASEIADHSSAAEYIHATQDAKREK